MVEIFDRSLEEIDTFIKQKEAKTVLGETKENLNELGLDVNLPDWLANDEKMLNYAKLHMKAEESKSFMDSIKEQFLELKLSITCSYFADFKIFIEELKKGEDTSSDDENKENPDQNPNSLNYIGQGHDFLGVDVSEIESQPLYRNPGTGVTRCSATARLNGANFALSLPRGNAFDAGTKAPNDNDNYKITIPKDKIDKRPKSSWEARRSEEFTNMDKNINFADIYLDSKSSYGHRAVAFRDTTGDRYVLDPYTRVNGVINDKPKKLSDYMRKRHIVKAHFYTSPKYEFKSKEYVKSKP